MSPRAGAVLVGIGHLLLLPAVLAADRPVDPGLLEFLGSVDSEDKGWHDYLVHTDIDRVARRAGESQRAPSSPPAPPPPTAGSVPPAPPESVSRP